MTELRFCPRCGGDLGLERPKPSEPERLVCGTCRFVFYQDPKLAAGVIFDRQGRITLGRRSIEPALGKWVFPGGFVDRGETVEEAARREALEEMNAEVRVRELLNVYSYPGVPVVVVVFSGELTGGELGVSDECDAIRDFHPDEMPWDELAFPSTRDAVSEYIRRYLGGPA